MDINDISTCSNFSYLSGDQILHEGQHTEPALATTANSYECRKIDSVVSLKRWRGNAEDRPEFWYAKSHAGEEFFVKAPKQTYVGDTPGKALEREILVKQQIENERQTLIAIGRHPNLPEVVELQDEKQAPAIANGLIVAHIPQATPSDKAFDVFRRCLDTNTFLRVFRYFVRIGLDVISTLGERKIVVNDLRPQNILLSRHTCTFYFIDFEHATSEGALFGRCNNTYAAPESNKPDKCVTHKTDVFMFGVTLLFLGALRRDAYSRICNVRAVSDLTENSVMPSYTKSQVKFQDELDKLLVDTGFEDMLQAMLNASPSERPHAVSLIRHQFLDEPSRERDPNSYDAMTQEIIRAAFASPFRKLMSTAHRLALDIPRILAPNRVENTKIFASAEGGATADKRIDRRSR